MLRELVLEADSPWGESLPETWMWEIRTSGSTREEEVNPVNRFLSYSTVFGSAGFSLTADPPRLTFMPNLGRLVEGGILHPRGELQAQKTDAAQAARWICS